MLGRNRRSRKHKSTKTRGASVRRVRGRAKSRFESAAGAARFSVRRPGPRESGALDQLFRRWGEKRRRPRKRRSRARQREYERRTPRPSFAETVWSPAKDSLLANANLAANILLLGLLGWALAWLFTSDLFYVNQIEVDGNQRVSTEAIQEASGLLGYSIFWVNPRQVATAVAQLLPPIRQVQVQSRLPNRVTLVVEEQGDQVMWQVGARRYWVDDEGYLHPVSGESEPCLLVNDIRPGPPTQVDVSAISAARQIIQLLPELRAIEYAPVTGLRFTHPRGWLVYLGTGDDMARKVSILRAMEVQFSGQEREQPALIDLRFPDSPYYRVSEGAGEN